MTIGRDTFWTPAHMAIYLGGVLAGLSGGWLALKTTFAGTPEERAAAVRFWGFRAPLGAWVAIWGALAMLTSAPFDDWWHNAYGLDVEILSPPHSVLAAGMIAIQLGAMLLALAPARTAPPGGRGAAARASPSSTPPGSCSDARDPAHGVQLPERAARGASSTRSPAASSRAAGGGGPRLAAALGGHARPRPSTC